MEIIGYVSQDLEIILSMLIFVRILVAVGCVCGATKERLPRGARMIMVVTVMSVFSWGFGFVDLVADSVPISQIGANHCQSHQETENTSSQRGRRGTAYGRITLSGGRSSRPPPHPLLAEKGRSHLLVFIFRALLNGS
jgi:hypothetical protein